MFYSHQLLARKAPLGQIWMAATLHAKMNRKKLDKLDLIKICEEILNPSVPMALRLSSILMGGVVIVYERKVKLLYDDVTRLVVEINEVWKIKQPASSVDPTLLPKSKTQARYKSVTLPPIEEGDPTVFDQSLNFTVMGCFQQQPPIDYITMNLDQVDASSFFTDQIPASGDIHNHHQAEAANITLMDPYDSNQATTSLFDQFERFDIEGDEDTQMNIATEGHSRGHSDHLHFTPIEEFHNQEMPPQEVPAQQVSPVDEEIRDVLRESQNKQQSDECGEDAQQAQEEHHPELKVTKRKARSRKNHLEMDYEQTMISGELYQFWLQKPADLVAGRGSIKKHLKPMSYMKTSHLMELPPTALLNGFSEFGSTQIYYPKVLLDLHMECVYPQPPQGSSSSTPGRKSKRPHPVATSSPTEAPPPVDNKDPLELAVEDVEGGTGSQPKGVFSIDPQMKNLRVDSAPKQLSIEKQMEKLDIYEFPHVTPGSEGSNEKPVHSSGSRNVLLPMEPLEKSSKKRGLISGRQSASGSGLDPVAEENPWDLAEPTLKIRRIYEEAPLNDHETLMETGPTQTPLPVFDDLQSLDKMTDAVRTHLKTHFDTPGNSAFESLNSLTSGMNTKRASLLFMQTLVLATHNVLKVQQAKPYSDILISKGPKM